MGAQAVRLSNVDIDNALKNKEFEVLFQPIFDLGNGALARVETFVRWRHPSLGVLPPGAFISFFETQGRMSELTRYVLAGALAAYSDWRGPYAPGFSINLALSDLSDDAFSTHFAKVLRDRDFAADLVTLECPMPPVDVDLDTASAYFARLAETGARLAIEVRGRANDLLRNIDPFPFDEIKTGGSAILRFARTVRGPGLSAIADLLDIANRSNAAITAVGVEDQASLAALRGLGFTAAQGNHLAKVGGLNEFRPGKVNEVRKLLDLEPLSADSLTALFRTEAPAPTAADPTEEVGSEIAGAETAAVPTDEAKKTRVREKAKALALAKRAKARDARKTAAIDRAKAKMAHAKKKALETTPADRPAEGTFPPSSAPRDLQEKLTKEFAAGDTAQDSHSPELKSEEALTLPNPKVTKTLPTPESDQSDSARPEPVAPEIVASEPGVLDAAPELSLSEEESSVSAEDKAIEEGEISPMPATTSKDTKPVANKAPSSKTSPEKKDAKETDEAGPSSAEPEENDPPISEHRDAADVPEKISMPVGAARAHFQPVIRVGSPALRSPEAPLPLPLQAPDQSVAQPQMPLDGDVGDEQTDKTIEDAVPAAIGEMASNSTHSEMSADQNADLTDLGDLDGDLESETVLPKQRKKHRRNFLTRKYDLVPTHFWPRSWKRRQRRPAMSKLNEPKATEAIDVTMTD